MIIGVVGLGFIGLTTALGFSKKGHTVYGFDSNRKRSEVISLGKIPFHEPYLTDVLRTHISKNFFITDTLGDAIRESEIVFFCVGTPAKRSGKTDLSHLEQALKETAKQLQKRKYKTLVIKSSVPPSTTKEKLKPLLESMGLRVGEDIGLANNPEFLREGFAWKDFIEPDRIIIGADDGKSSRVVSKAYRSFGAPLCMVSLTTAEFIKYLSNTLLATMISFSNEMSLIANAIGNVNVPQAFKILNLDKRWFGNPANMATYVYPGCGFGGYCLPKDVSGLYAESRGKGYKPLLLKEVMKVNKKIKDHVAEMIAAKAKKNDRIGILGLSFKPNSDDVRETSAKDIVETLLRKGFTNIIGYDPLAMENFKNTYRLPIRYARTLNDVAREARHLVILTAWQEFREKKAVFRGKSVLDFRYMLENPLT